MTEISRRDFIKSVGTNAVAISLFNGSNVFGNNFGSIDNLTEKMLSELGKATRADVKDYKPDYYDNASFSVSTRIKGYDIRYWVPGDGLLDENEALLVKSEGESWRFEGKGSLEKAVKSFSYEHNKWHYTLNPEYATHVPIRIRDLLDITIHLQDCKGKDLTNLVDSLLKKVLSIENFEIKSWFLSTRASFEKRDFKIEYEFNDTSKRVRFTILDGKNRLEFHGKYNKNEGIDTLSLSINSRELSANSSYFSFDSGKLEKFPRKVYNETSALYIVNQAKGIERYLTSTVKNIKPA